MKCPLPEVTKHRTGSGAKGRSERAAIAGPMRTLQRSPRIGLRNAQAPPMGHPAIRRPREKTGPARFQRRGGRPPPMSAGDGCQLAPASSNLPRSVFTGQIVRKTHRRSRGASGATPGERRTTLPAAGGRSRPGGQRPRRPCSTDNERGLPHAPLRPLILSSGRMPRLLAASRSPATTASPTTAAPTSRRSWRKLGIESGRALTRTSRLETARASTSASRRKPVAQRSPATRQESMCKASTSRGLA